MCARLRCGGNLPLCLTFGTGVLGVLWWLGGLVVWWFGGWHSVPERATYGTEYACRAQKGFLGYATHFQKASVLKTGFYGTRRIFKGPQNSRLHRLWTASCRSGRSFSARNSPRSEVSRHKKRVYSLEMS